MAKKLRDYCTLSPDKALGKNWRVACAYHDEGYAEVKEIRKRADLEFRKRMEKYSWKPVATLYYYGVRIFGRLVV